MAGGGENHFRVLGSLEVSAGGQVVEIGSAKQRALLVALVSRLNQPVAVDALIAVVWDGRPPDSAEVTIRGLVSRVRRTVRDGGTRIDMSPAGYVLRADPAQVDAVGFEQLLARGRSYLAEGRADLAVPVLGEGLGLWRGRALAELADHEFVRPRATALEEGRLLAVEELIEAQLAVGLVADAVAQLEPHLAAHPLREHAWGQLMRGLYRQGRQADALAAYRRLHCLLRDELGVTPSPGIRRLEQQILRQHPRLDEHPPGAGPPAIMAVVLPRRHLPTPPSPLIGRTAALATLPDLLTSTRLLTLTGVGGVGKTRLALQLATDTADRFPDGVRFVELASLHAEATLATEVAARLEVSAVGAQDQAGLLDRIGEHLGHRRMLLVFDNCEHLIAAAAELVDALLTGCPQLTVLTTSREPLGVAGETVWSVSPLSLPPVEAGTPVELAKSDAVALFCERASAVQPGFGVTANNAAAIGQICRHLDGIPLALELAAARLRVLAAQQIASRLDDRFRLLTGGARTALPRQQTLQATLDWSYQLLPPAEQAALRSLAVFPRSFDLAAAEAVVDTTASSDRWPAAELVFRLVDKSLVVAKPRHNQVRYELLETVRSYGAELLARAGEAEQVRRRHRDHFLRRVTDHEDIRQPRWHTAEWLRQVRADEDNFQSATLWSLEQDDHQGALLLLCGLWWYWLWGTPRVDAVTWLDHALAGDGGHDTHARLEATIALAVLNTWWEYGDPERSRRLFDQAQQLAERLGDDTSRYRVRFFYGEFLLLRGDTATARAVFHQAQQCTSDPGYIAWCHHSLGWIAMSTGDAALARQEFERAVAIGPATDPVFPHALAALAPLSARAGQRNRAESLAAQALSIATPFPLPGILVMALARAAQTRLLNHDDEAAAETLRRLFELLHQRGTRQFYADAFDMAAILAEHSGRHDRAAVYFGVGDVIRETRAEEHGEVRVLADLVEASRRRSMTMIGNTLYTEAESEGRRLPIRDALAAIRVELALESHSTVHHPDLAASKLSPGQPI